MALYLERYTIPHDLPEEDIVYTMRRLSRGDVHVQRCFYSLSGGLLWCLTDAPDEAAIRRGLGRIRFAATLDALAPLDGAFDPRATRPGDVGEAARARGG
ncbi:MAG TPA: hypothetical protein VKV26_08295 [Dehalococcoidia bacterium]|nr:hypothetical protein [Dehalococcoidia bacterium]